MVLSKCHAIRILLGIGEQKKSPQNAPMKCATHENHHPAEMASFLCVHLHEPHGPTEGSTANLISIP